MNEIVKFADSHDGIIEFIQLLLEENGDKQDGQRVFLSPPEVNQVRAVLRQLKNHPFNQADGGVSAILGQYQFPLRRTICSAVAITASLAGGIVTVLLDPVTGTIVLVGSLLDAAQRAADLIHKLTPEEVVVYEALASALKEKKAQHQPLRATEAEVNEVLKQRKLAAPNTPAVLTVLVQKSAVKSDAEAGSVMYWIEL